MSAPVGSPANIAAGGRHFQRATVTDKMAFFTMLSLDNLSKSYGGRKILDGVSWSMADDGRVGSGRA